MKIKLIILLLIFQATGFHDYAQTTNNPNIIIIFTDDLGYGDLGVYGHPTINTPHLDKMADQGMLFSQFYVAASVCTPSRAGLLTGRYPIRTGLVKGLIPGRVLFPNDQTGLPAEEVTIAEMLKTRNYATMAVGKWHLGHLPEYLPTAQGFDSYYGIPYSNDMDYTAGKDGQSGFNNVPLMQDTVIVERPVNQETITRRYTEVSVEFIEKNKGNPFFLYLAHTMPHVPLFVSDKFKDTSARGLYGDVIAEIDWSVGQIVSAIQENNLAENTLVIFTSDNGPWLVKGYHGGSSGLLKDGKGTTWEGGMRVPMIAWWPGKIPAGVKSLEMATTLDLMPTIADFTGAELPDRTLDGYSILPVLTRQDKSSRDHFIFYRDDKVYAIRKGPWKAHFLTQTAYPAGPLREHNPPLLYNLENDPSETIDISKNNPDIVAEIQKIYFEHHEQMGSARLPEIEAESLIDIAKVSGGRLRIQDMSNFGEWGDNKQLWWVEAKPGDELSLPVKVDNAGRYQLIGFFTRANDYGIIRLHINGKPLPILVEGYGQGIKPTGPISFGEVELLKGENIIQVELVGKESRSSGYSEGYLVGIDGFTLMRIK